VAVTATRTMRDVPGEDKTTLEVVLSWIWLVLAGLCEVVWVVALGRSEGFTRPGASALTVAALIASVGLLGVAMREIPLGVAYVVWVGIGVAGTAVLSVVWLGEEWSAWRLGAIALVVLGVAGLKAS